MKRTISVAIATYNGEKYIAQQLNSIIGQTLRVSEIVICDDCSSDRTIEIAKGILQKNNIPYRIVIHENNMGVIVSFFEAIKLCNGEIVFLSDQDDVWKPEKVIRFIRKFEEDDNYALCFSNAQLVDSKLNALNKTLWEAIGFKSNKCNTQSDYIHELLRRNIFTGMSMAFDKKKILDRPLYLEEMLHDEMIGWTAVINYKIGAIDEILALYRQHEDNIKGIKRKSIFNVNKDTKSIVLNSNKRYYRKFEIIAKYMGNDSEYMPIVKNCAEFYRWKCQLSTVAFRDAISQIIKRLFRGDYRRFTSRSDHALLKDLYIASH